MYVLLLYLTVQGTYYPWDFLFSIKKTFIFHNILTLYFHKKRRFNSINPFGGNPTFRALDRSGSRDTRWHMTSHAIHVLSRRAECDSHGWAEYRPATSNGPLNRFQVEQQYVHFFCQQILNHIPPSSSLEQNTNFKHRRAPAMLHGACADGACNEETCRSLSQ